MTARHAGSPPYCADPMISAEVSARPARRPGVRLAVTGCVLVVPVPVLCFLTITLLVAATGDGPRHTATGLPAALAMALLVAGAVSFVAGALLTVIGAVAFLGSRPQANAEAHARLRLARDTATTPGVAAALQMSTVPGRGWRRVLPFAPVAGPLAVAVVSDKVGLDTLGRWALIAVVPGAVWIVLRQVRRQQVVGAALRQQGLRDDVDPDDQPAVDRRAAAVAAFAAARNLPYAPADPSGYLGRTGVCNVVRGTVDGTPFTLSDRITEVETQVENGPRRTHITGASTTVTVPFPTVVGLAVAPDSAEATLRWSYLGPQVQLESGDFNAAFNVYCDDPVRARLVLNPAVMAALLDWPDPLQLVLADGELRLTTPTTLTPTARLDALVALAARIEHSARAALV